MIVRNKKGYKNAVVIDESILCEMHECVEKYFTKLEYSAETEGEAHIIFSSFNELKTYSNFGSSAIMHLKCSFNEGVLEFRPTSSVLHSYNYSVVMEYATENIEKNMLFDKEIREILDKAKRPWYYTFITKFSMAYLLIFLLSIMCLLYGVIFALGMSKMMNDRTGISILDINGMLVSSFLIFGFTMLLVKLRRRIFPVITFKIGDQIKVIEKREDLVSKVFWGVIVTGMMSVIIAICI